jgi:hypothetical protein
MPHKLFVTIGTDGVSDWVQLADGQKLMLGPISILKFVTELGVGGPYGARKTLDEFIREGTSMLTVDADRMQELLKPHRARWTSVRPTIPLVPRSDRTPTTSRQVKAMANEDFVKDAINNQIGRIEAQIALLQSHSKEASPNSISSDMMKSELDHLKNMVAFLRRPSVYGDQSKNKTFYGLPEKTPGGESARSKEAAIQDNTKVARSILAALAQTEEKIDHLVLAGKEFDVARAKGDLHRVARNVHTILQHPKFQEADSHVSYSLSELNKRASALHGLFASAKV